MPVRVVVNGIGTIGKRVAHAIRLQDDMKLVGISTRSPSFVLKTVLEPGAPLYGVDLWAANQNSLEAMRNAGMIVNGTLEELLASGEVDVVVDCTSEGVGETLKPLYQKYKVKQVFQGGEKAHVADLSFTAIASYEKAFGATSVRVVSCNTTSLVRTIFTVEENFGVEEVFAALVRRAADPWEDEKGPINAITPDLKIPSHHAPDVKTVLPNLNITSMAVKVPTTLAHFHMIHAKVKKETTTEKLLEVFRNGSRILTFKGSEGYTSTAKILEKFRDLGRIRSDMYEVAVIEELVAAKGKDVYWGHMVHQEAIVVPENVDAIRAMFELERDKFKSIEKTNRSLGIKH